MKIFKQIFYLLFIFVTSCGYQSIETYYKGDFQITELNITGNKNINRIIDRNLKKTTENNNSSNLLKIEIKTDLNKSIITKNSKGEATRYDMKININLKTFKNEKIVLEKIYSKNNSYNTLESKYELKQYEKILINDSVKEIIQKIKQDLNSI